MKKLADHIYYIWKLPLAMGLALLFIFSCTRSADTTADMVLNNGHIVTMDSVQTTASALAVKDNKILSVGSDDDIRPYISI